MKNILTLTLLAAVLLRPLSAQEPAPNTVSAENVPATAAQPAAPAPAADATAPAEASSESAVTGDPSSPVTGEELTRVAVLELGMANAAPAQANQLTRELREALSRTGVYYVLNSQEMLKRQTALNERLPYECTSQKCVLAAGQLLAVSKVVIGEVDVDGNLTILRLRLFDLESRDFDAKAVVASDCPQEKWNQLAMAGVCQLLNLELKDIDITLVKYKGREVNHKMEWAVAGGLTVAAAVVYGILSGALSPSGAQNDALTVTDYDMDNLAYQHGAFADLMYSARAHGMGGAFIALSDDANAMAYNPAGMVRAAQRSFTAGYLRYNFGYATYPYFYTGYVNKVTRTLSHGEAIITSSGKAFGSSETQIITSVAKVFDEVSDKLRPFSVGASLKFLMLTADKATDEVYAWQENAVSGGGFGGAIDLGAQFELTDRITAALLLRDLFSTVKYTNTTTGKQYREGVPANIIVGGHYRLHNTLNLTLDGNKSLYTDTEDNIRMGLEKWVFDVLALRIGMSQNFSMESQRRYHFGLGLDIAFKQLKQRMGADYSYEYFKMGDSKDKYEDLSGAQRFALSYKF
ncbi:MAG: hypothetical protein V1913_06670 [Fibrobacterota bacterium]